MLILIILISDIGIKLMLSTEFKQIRIERMFMSPIINTITVLNCKHFEWVALSLSLSLSLSSLSVRTADVVVTTGAIRRAKLQSNRHQQQTNAQVFFTAWIPFMLPNQQCRRLRAPNEFMSLLVGVYTFRSSDRPIGQTVCPTGRSDDRIV